MGLALVHGIVVDYGGAVTVYSEVDKGTTFNIFFPRVATAEFPAEAEQQEPLRGTERILLVDDERTQAQSIRNMLKRLGYQVAVRTDAEQALAAFRKDPDRFDLVITDQIMPKLTGVQPRDPAPQASAGPAGHPVHGVQRTGRFGRGPRPGHPRVPDEAVFHTRYGWRDQEGVESMSNPGAVYFLRVAVSFPWI